ncbi:MAG: hypothetical protein ACT4PL_12075, partial [Phycisphaerales bacterium]
MMNRHPRSRAALSLLCATGLALGAFSCGPGKASRVEEADPASIAKDVRVDDDRRAAALGQMWAERLPSEQGRLAARESLKSVAWASANGARARAEAIGILASDAEDVESADTRAMLALMLPIEPDTELTRMVGELAVARGWRELAGPLARSLGRKLGATKDRDRAEAKTLVGLFPERTLEETLFQVFATPPAEGLDGRAARRAEEARRGAWEALSRLDPDGSGRARWVAALAAVTGDALTETLRACAAELGCFPLTASELRRVERLRNPADGAAAAWWKEAARAVSMLRGVRAGELSLRHVEAIRWTAGYHAERLSRTRESLLDELRSRLRGRSVVGRNVGDVAGTSTNRNRLEDWSETLGFCDVLTILAVDDSLRSPGLAQDLLKQAERDRTNTTTEYGGTLMHRGPGVVRTGSFVAVLYIPRASGQGDDRRFVASEEML